MSISSEFGRSPNNERCSILVPRNHIVGCRIVNKLVCFSQKRRRNSSTSLSGHFTGFLHR
ncbi:hypothetical protein HanXRQr2_Chr06g0240111 [Helianthus annuus]|uniref:Uncharacterized protein n=1 Tax=Helianthus annuus TaxID=4232 RepID=A0A9K3IPK7_HELAN|nr:hypothetical protein HanXRQr2_Chr06g0240111 [Helianthus annuus]